MNQSPLNAVRRLQGNIFYALCFTASLLTFSCSSNIPLSAPTNIHISYTSQYHYIVSWDKVDGAELYQVYIRFVGGVNDPWHMTEEVEGTSYENGFDSFETCADTVSYKIKAVSKNLSSDYSSIAKATYCH